MANAAPSLRFLRWQSRRGLLELDLLLERFWRRHEGALTAGELHLLAGWLALPDADLWQTLRQPPAAGAALARKINDFTKENKQQRSIPHGENTD